MTSLVTRRAQEVHIMGGYGMSGVGVPKTDIHERKFRCAANAGGSDNSQAPDPEVRRLLTPVQCALPQEAIGRCWILCLLLRIDRAPALRGNSSIHDFAGRRGFEMLAIFAALLPLRSVLILYDLLRHLGRLRGRRSADDRCRARDRCPRSDSQNLPPGNSL